MKLYFSENLGNVMDLFYSLYFIYNDNYTSFLNKLNLPTNKNVLKTLEQLSKKLDYKNNEFKVLFGEYTLLASSLINTETAWKMNDLFSITEYLKSLDEKEIHHRIIKDLDNEKIIDNKNIDNLLNNNKLLMDFIDKSDIIEELKWDLIKFLYNTDEIMNKFIIFIENYLKKYKTIMEKNNKFIKKHSQYLNEGIRNKGINFLKEVTNNTIDFDSYKEIYISPMFFNSTSIVFRIIDEKLFLTFGIDFEKSIKQLSGEGEIEKNISIFNCLSDKTRFKILQLLINKRLFSQEIAGKVGISIGTVSYHMNFLLASNLVIIEREGHKTFYKFNKEILQNTTDFLNKTFNLNN